jgi:hypothetical protein
MNIEFLFQFSNIWVVPGWVLLWFFPRRTWTPPVVIYIVISLLALLYSVLLFGSSIPFDPDAFGSLAGIKSMFGNDRLLLAGWIHYLAFDLSAGILITSDSLKIGFPVWLRVPVLFFVFMMGPFGMLLYLILRIFFVKKISWT